jgi:tRNA(Ile)-lysidine synthase
VVSSAIAIGIAIGIEKQWVMMSIPRALQALPPEDAHTFLEVERFVLHDLGLDPRGSSLLVALSGGADSTALLLFCTVMSGRWGAAVHAAHLDHMLRERSRAEAERVGELCSRLGVGLTTERIDVRRASGRSSSGIEEAARQVRYDFLERARRAVGADFLLTGHHADDLAEDILMRLIRGAGWPGLAGMRAWDPERSLVRPFLTTPKGSLTALLSRQNIDWVEDESNQEITLLRNRVRRCLLPLLSEQNPNIRHSLVQLWMHGRIDESFWEAALSWAPSATSAEGEMLLPADSLSGRHRAERLRAYKRCLDRLGPGQPLFESLLRLDDAFLSGRVGGMHQFPGGKTAKLLPEGISFVRAR